MNLVCCWIVICFIIVISICVNFDVVFCWFMVRLLFWFFLVLLRLVVVWCLLVVSVCGGYFGGLCYF